MNESGHQQHCTTMSRIAWSFFIFKNLEKFIHDFKQYLCLKSNGNPKLDNYTRQVTT